MPEPPVIDTTSWVATAIRERRERRGWAQAELARRLGRTQTSVSYWESGKRTPGLDDLIDLAEVLEVDVEEFIPPANARRPVSAVLRATAERLASGELARAIDDLLDAASALSIPPARIRTRAGQPAYAANELLEQWGVRRPPVDVEAIAHACGTLVIKRRFPDALSGLVFASDGGAVVGINADHHPNRQRFSLAHELGHFVLGHHSDGLHQRVHLDVTDGTPPGYDWRQERAANDFAADLLMPRRLVSAAFEQVTSPADLSQLFDVSEIAMGYRLVNLGLR